MRLGGVDRRKKEEVREVERLQPALGERGPSVNVTCGFAWSGGDESFKGRSLRFTHLAAANLKVSLQSVLTQHRLDRSIKHS